MGTNGRTIEKKGSETECEITILLSMSVICVPSFVAHWFRFFFLLPAFLVLLLFGIVEFHFCWCCFGEEKKFSEFRDATLHTPYRIDIRKSSFWSQMRCSIVVSSFSSKFQRREKIFIATENGIFDLKTANAGISWFFFSSFFLLPFFFFLLLYVHSTFCPVHVYVLFIPLLSAIWLRQWLRCGFWYWKLNSSGYVKFLFSTFKFVVEFINLDYETAATPLEIMNFIIIVLISRRNRITFD